MCTHLNWYRSWWFLRQNLLSKYSVAFLAVEILDEWHVTNFFLLCCCPTRAMAPSFMRFRDHTQRRTTVGRTPLVEWSARRRYLHLTQHSQGTDIHAPPGFEPTVSGGERPQTYALDCAATGICYQLLILSESVNRILCCNLIVAPSVKKLPACFGNEGKNKIPIGTYSGSSIHPSVLFF